MVMNITVLKQCGLTRACNVYLITGSPAGVDTIIDPGNDVSILADVERYAAGLSDFRLAQVVLTNSSREQLTVAKALKKRYRTRVLAYGPEEGVDERLYDGQIIEAGDDFLEVLHTPDHFQDSICLYSPSEKLLFSSNYNLLSGDQHTMHSIEYVETLLKIACRDIKQIYFSNDVAVTTVCQELILYNIRTLYRQSLCSRIVVATNPETEPGTENKWNNE